MSKGMSLRLLWTSDAVQVHLVCWTLIVLLSVSMWTGNAQPDYIYGLLFSLIVYPILLALVWCSQRLGGWV